MALCVTQAPAPCEIHVAKARIPGHNSAVEIEKCKGINELVGGCGRSLARTGLPERSLLPGNLQGKSRYATLNHDAPCPISLRIQATARKFPKEANSESGRSIRERSLRTGS